jgi:hypothetical protein
VKPPTQFGPYTVLDLHALPEDGKRFELEDGWLVERAASSLHNGALRTLARIIERAAAQAGSQAVVCDGGEWEISTPLRYASPTCSSFPETSPARPSSTNPPAHTRNGALPGKRSHLLRQRERAHGPAPQGQRVLPARDPAVLDRRAQISPHRAGSDPGRRHLHGCPTVVEGTRPEAVIDVDKPITVSFDPAELLDF